ncbi:phosphate transporter, Major Facilitator Superfamily (MFS) [Sulfurimonas gotlandica GD1]|uniref:Phosphate transporter n=1 Tax=Sulfurimonas gotlandica (strain DSM 19862 / JCM 16533 / GD1) TaxID=929558 RepID=B6BHY7_SULGG|nr:inorganic phosphate transporter [Sulfurimonas gotlandica]EDZ62805.1 phosphate transporter [Sulfurimonas gotlandica GD1]EHP30139.1 phosphate transporter, Major Facilitator Superfamily (MFS) [Sulfurimonas gotlandica GD1]
MEIQTVKKMEKEALKGSGIDFMRLGFALFFMVAVLAYSFLSLGSVPNSMFLAIAALFGAYMAMNIGANDVANNVGPAVGSKALTMGGAIVIAAIFEAGGAFIAGGDVVKTIKKGIIDINAFGGNVDPFIWAMMAALLAAALWLNFATAMKAPVSTTHSIVGGVMGAGIAAAGFSIVDWGTMAKIASSWIISPVLGGVIAATFLFAIKKTMVYKEDKITAAKIWVPIFVAIMSWAFVTYLTLKGLKKIWPSIVDVLSFLPDEKKPSFIVAAIFGLIIAAIVYFIVKKTVTARAAKLDNTRAGINLLFTVPLIFAAALLSFAHGANDVANAIGPLAAISDAVTTGGISAKAGIPFWVMAVGALGIAIGLALYGPKLIKTVGGEITELDQMRAFSVAMAASITVIIASQLGLPVSSTHIAIGGIFGVGFLREYLVSTNQEEILHQEELSIEDEKKVLKAYTSERKTLEDKSDKTKDDYERIVNLYKMIDEEENKIKSSKKHIKSVEKVKYVKRDAVKKIIAAWIITVPAAALLSAAIFFMIKGIVL